MENILESQESRYEVYNVYPGQCNVANLSKSDRQKAWYKLEIPRPSGNKDKYYTHLQSDIRCRSLVEVYKFIQYGNKKAPLTNADNSYTGRVARKRTGTSLVKETEVGCYIFNKYRVYRKIMTDPQTTHAANGDNMGGYDNQRHNPVPIASNATIENEIRERGGIRLTIYDYLPLE